MAAPLPLEARARAGASWLATDKGARLAFGVAVAVAIVIWYIVGRRQWFIRDDWAFLVTRDLMHDVSGWKRWLLQPTAGHWMTVPILVYRGLHEVFGLDSYWPYLAINLALHLGIVLAVRRIMRRVGVSEWTNTLVASTLLVFGAGWENIVFAIQITCNLSLLAFLVQILLVDHDGPVNRRDVLGSVLAVIGVMSSGFGWFFLFGIAVLLVLRRRWIALAVAAVPQGVLLAWWALTYGDESSEPRVPGSRSQANIFAIRGMLAVFDSLTATLSLAGLALLGTLIVTLWRRPGWRTQSVLLTLAVTACAMYVGLGFERIGFGLDSGAISRYQHIGAMLLAPAFALAIDQLRRLAAEAQWAGRLVLVAAVTVNASNLHTNGNDWANRARAEQHVLELVAGSPLTATVDPDLRPLPFSPDVSIASLPKLVADGAFQPRTPTTPEDEALVRSALHLSG